MTKDRALQVLYVYASVNGSGHCTQDEFEEAKKMAIKALEGNGVAQERKYTFGNDEFSLEAAYHDCKLVFDGITDDDSFQEADTGAILYYANEIIYALHEALEGKDNVPDMDVGDIISKQSAIDAITDENIIRNMDSVMDSEMHRVKRSVHRIIASIPSAQTERPNGHWVINSDGYYPYCSECRKEPKSGDMTDFCPNCGADMRGEQND